MTLKEYAKEYVKTVYGPVNAWGQCVHPILGRSDELMIRMYRLFGGVPTEHAIDEELRNFNRKGK